ncbi:guanine deaminase [Clostridium ragsdalei P11]|uniref:Guanine deaminase n=1 Tax=Clostridium ragsdalei P11 TaxID=1353534 RepID=A0A1A6AVF0_9CLOT|nr:guanine deaminase [Clostridium ragsdalei]OBR94027.1 guanine deaminase [Clostridium ragsdalei P11]
MEGIYIVKGNIIFTKTFGKFEVFENGYIVVEGKCVKGVYKNLPEKFSKIRVIDYGDAIIIPGFVDLHLHASQYGNLGLGLDKELMPWLQEYTFPEEAKYADTNYAKKVYSALIRDLWRFGTTRSCVFATIHKDSTKLLMDLFAKSGLSAYVGKVNMNRNSPEYLVENTEDSIYDTEEILKEYCTKYELVKPIITPRFVPSCSMKLLKSLGNLAKKYNVPVQSHLCENNDEVKFVKELHPDCKNYARVYDRAGLLGDVPTIMAHCILVDEDEIELMNGKNVFIAHNPSSNCNLSSGIAPIRRFVTRGIPVGLGSDISAGHSLSMTNVIVNSGQASNLKWLQSSKVDKPFSTAELFYLATKGGGKFFGKVGSFENGYDFDALVIDDSSLSIFKQLSIEERLQKFIYTGDDRNIKERYVAGKKIEEPKCY